MRQLPAVLAVTLAAAFASAASPRDELRIKREQVFEFAQKPNVRRNGDAIAITFASRGFCDCTVAIENDEGRIVRHLASGVLGDNAPPPFKKDSRKQTVVWDGKDDLGRFINDKSRLTVRVSLGLKPRFERTLFWNAKRRTQCTWKSFIYSDLPVPAPEGVYVYRGENAEYVQLFDHDGNYVRTVYPFPRDKLKDVKGLKWVSFPPTGEKFPVKWSIAQNTLLTSSVGVDENASWPGGGVIASTSYRMTSAMAVRPSSRSTGSERAGSGPPGRIALAGFRLNRLATDGSTPQPLSASSGHSATLTLNGPRTTFKRPREEVYGFNNDKQDTNVLPRSMAFSPDGRWVYLTGYMAWWSKYRSRYWLHGLARVRFGGAEDAECWIGKMGEYGPDNAHFSIPTSVAVDAKGRVYVSDYLNDRIQVFSQEGRHLKTIPVKKPMQVSLHPKTGDLYVCSWLMSVKRKIADKGALGNNIRVPATLTHLGPFEAPQVKATYALPLREYKETISANPKIRAHQGLDYRVEVDLYVDPPRVWIVPFTERSRIVWASANVAWKYEGKAYEMARFSENIEIYELKEGPSTALRAGPSAGLRAGKLELKRSFSDDVKKTVIREAPPEHARQRLYFDHKNEYLYVGEARDRAIAELVRIRPADGAIRLERLPFSAEDLAFDMRGRLHLRSYGLVARYEDSGPRELPYEYGEETLGRGTCLSVEMPAERSLVGGLPFYSELNSSRQLGGIAISPWGVLAATTLDRRKMPSQDEEAGGEAFNRLQPRSYPGRAGPWRVCVWDAKGRVRHRDAVPGCTRIEGIGIDKDDNIYLQVAGRRVLRRSEWPNRMACTLIKVRAGKAKFVSTEKAGIPLDKRDVPKRPPDIQCEPFGDTWVENVEWCYGGVGLRGGVAEIPPAATGQTTSRFALDFFARSFVSETDRYRIAVLDTNGNLITRIGKYGNVDDGLPLVKDGGPPKPRSIGGDEVAIMHCLNMTTHTDKRLFLSDWGNYRILSVKLGYHAEEKVALKDELDRE